MQLPVDLAVMAAGRAGAGMGQRVERRSSSEGEKQHEEKAQGRRKHTQNLGEMAEGVQVQQVLLLGSTWA